MMALRESKTNKVKHVDSDNLDLGVVVYLMGRYFVNSPLMDRTGRSDDNIATVGPCQLVLVVLDIKPSQTAISRIGGRTE